MKEGLTPQRLGEGSRFQMTRARRRANLQRAFPRGFESRVPALYACAAVSRGPCVFPNRRAPLCSLSKGRTMRLALLDGWSGVAARRSMLQKCGCSQTSNSAAARWVC